MNSAAQFIEKTNLYIHQLFEQVCAHIHKDEQLKMNFDCENTLFIRFHQSKVRQNTYIFQETVSLELLMGQKSVQKNFNLTGHLQNDVTKSIRLIESIRTDFLSMEDDPFVTPFQTQEKSFQVFEGEDFDFEIGSYICDSVKGNDFNGIWASGPIVRATITSLGADHFFATNSYFLDYSVYNGIKSVKGIVGGLKWNDANWKQHLQNSLRNLSMMVLPEQKIPRGQYKVYLAPDAVAELIHIMNWGGFSQDTFQKGASPFQKIIRNEAKLSPLFSIQENFELGLCPIFNSSGETSPSTLPLIKNGEFVNLLTNSRSEKEYNVPSNRAGSYESIRSPEISNGTLKQQDILNHLGTGIYISNLHYLNWSDLPKGRFTGMTRYACFWVQDGVIQGPIQHLRFDESLLECLGHKLEAITEHRDLIISSDTYESRHTGGYYVPGLIINDFTFTL